MGNRTRKQHNQRKRKSTAQPQAPVGLEFPFHEVDDLTVMFGANIPGFDKVIKACPPEFRQYRNRWTHLANSIFFGGADMSAWKWREPALKAKQVRYLKAWLGSFDPRHEDKEAVCGWLLSLMLVEYPGEG